MDITRELLENTRWQCKDGAKLPITKLDDNHLKNAIKMLERLDEVGSYSHVLLCAERTYRAAEQSQDKDEANGQTTMDLPTVIQADVEPPQSIMRVRAAGRIRIIDNMDLVMESIDRIALKHHGSILDELDDPRDWGYDGDVW